MRDPFTYEFLRVLLALEEYLPNTVLIGGCSILSLMEEAGFAGRTLESRHTQYFKFESRLGTGFEVEFLTPAPSREHGETIVVQGGIRAQVLDGSALEEANGESRLIKVEA